MKKTASILFIVIFSTFLLSQDFPPPEEVYVDDVNVKLMWEPPSIITWIDTLENYSPGDYLAVESPNWTTWSNLPGSSEDALISDEYNWNTAKIENETNLIMEMNNYNSGRFSFHIGMYIPENHCAYFSLQKTNIPGEELGFEVFFGADTTATINAGGEASMQFPYLSGYSEFNLIIDLDNDWAELYYFKYLLYDYQWSLGATGNPGLNSIGGVNISTQVLPGSNDESLFYISNARLRKQYTNEEGLIGYNIYLDGMLWEYINSPIATKYYYEYLYIGETYIAGISSVYQNPIGESDVISFEFTYNISGVGPFPPENVFACVNNYNEVHLTWDYPFWILNHSLYGYHIYRNNVFVHRVLGPDILSLQDYPLPADNYEYYLEGIYLQNPDFPMQSNTANCVIEFPIPNNVTAITYAYDILLEWALDPPTQRDLIGFNIYKDDILLAENILEYSYLDENVQTGTYIYNVSALFSGNHESEFSEDIIINHVDFDENELSPVKIGCSNYPNPFNPSTTIKFSIQNDSYIELVIYNIKGQKIKNLANNEFSRGNHSIIWNGDDEFGKPISSGIYYYKLNINGKSEVIKKCLLLK